MPSGKFHSFTTVLLSAGLAYGSYHIGWPVQQAAALTGGALAGLLLTPDLDVNSGSISNYHARRMGGAVFGLAWEILWKPYSLLVPHRSIFSHFPGVGTALRLGYLAAIIWLILVVFHLVGVVHMPTVPVWWPWAFAGLVLSDALHFVLDILHLRV